MNYLDNAATTLVKPRAVGEALHRALTGAAGTRGAAMRRRSAQETSYTTAASRRRHCSACTTRRASYLHRTPRTRSISPSMRSQDRG